MGDPPDSTKIMKKQDTSVEFDNEHVGTQDSHARVTGRCLPEFEMIEKKQRANKRSRDKREKLRQRGFALTKYKNVHEFGIDVDFTDLGETERYLEYLERWLRSLKLPRDYDSCKDFGRAYFKRKYHRVIAVGVLAGAGNRNANILIKLRNGMTKEEYERVRYKPEGQFVETIVISTLVPLFMMMLMLGLGYYVFKEPIQRLKQVAFKATNVIDRSDTITGAVTTVMSAIKEACGDVWRFFKSLFEKVLGFFDLHEGIGKEVFVVFLKIVLVIVAFEYARTFFIDQYEGIVDFIQEKLGLKTVKHFKESGGPEGQAGDGKEYNILEKILNFIRKNFGKLKKRTFWEHMCEIPRIVSVAKALEWIFDNLKNLYGVFAELWTLSLIHI